MAHSRSQTIYVPGVPIKPDVRRQATKGQRMSMTYRDVVEMAEKVNQVLPPGFGRQSVAMAEIREIDSSEISKDTVPGRRPIPLLLRRKVGGAESSSSTFDINKTQLSESREESTSFKTDSEFFSSTSEMYPDLQNSSSSSSEQAPKRIPSNMERKSTTVREIVAQLNRQTSYSLEWF